MKSELIVDVRKEEIEIALLEDGRLQEFSKDQIAQQYSVGDIYYGRVKKVLPALNAVFVDVGYNKEAFLHYYDLGADFRTMAAYVKQVVSNRKKFPDITDIAPQPPTGKDGQIGDVLSAGDEVLVQIIKEPISTKGPRLSAEISFAGRYMVLLPFGNNVSVSTKIKKSSERSRLRQAIMRFKPEGFGVIVRTVAEDKTVEELSTEFDALLDKWYEAMRKLQQQSHIVPQLVSQEMDRTMSIVRDVLNPSFDHIYINNLACYQEIKEYVKVIAPDRAGIVEHYVETTPIFDKFGVTRQLKSGMGRTVSCKNGAYLIIDHTEALHVIDVNSGTRNKNEIDQEQNSFDVNIAAAEEIVHQLRLRDMGGIIVIDFIDMHTPEHKQQLYDYVRNLMENDRARHNVLPLSKFGLMQITRQRVRPVVDIEVKETCPTCHGTGKVDTSVFITDEIEQKLAFLSDAYKHEVVLYVHPFVEAYISKGMFFNSLKWKWKRKYGALSVVPNERLGFLEYKFYDRGGSEINIEALMHPVEDDYLDELRAAQQQQQANQNIAPSSEQPQQGKKKKKHKKKKSLQPADTATAKAAANDAATAANADKPQAIEPKHAETSGVKQKQSTVPENDKTSKTEGAMTAGQTEITAANKTPRTNDATKNVNKDDIEQQTTTITDNTKQSDNKPAAKSRTRTKSKASEAKRADAAPATAKAEPDGQPMADAAAEPAENTKSEPSGPLKAEPAKKSASRSKKAVKASSDEAVKAAPENAVKSSGDDVVASSEQGTAPLNDITSPAQEAAAKTTAKRKRTTSSATKAKAAKSAATDTSATKAKAAISAATGESAAKPKAAISAATGESAAKPKASKSAATGSSAANPKAAKSAATDASATKSKASKSAASRSSAAKPKAAKSAATDASAAKPKAAKSTTSNRKTAKSQAAKSTAE